MALQRVNKSCTENPNRADGVQCTWEDKDEAGCQSSDQRDHSTNIWDEEGEDEGDDKPHQRLQDPPPPLTTYTHLYLFTLETQPKSLYNCPKTTHDHSRVLTRKDP